MLGDCNRAHRRKLWVVLTVILIGCGLKASWLMDCVRMRRIKALNEAEITDDDLSLLMDGLGSDCECSWVWR
jgi:hypothetical protein